MDALEHGLTAPSDPSLEETLPSLVGPPPDELVRGAAVGRYVVLGRLGSGGMGIVYAAYDPELDRKVAVKLLRLATGRAAGDTARLLREAQAMARLTSPYVISVYDVGTVGEEVFIAMEFVDGGTLREWLRERPRSVAETLRHLLEAGRGLAAAHAVGLVHRDFKPENVLVSKHGAVRVADFGLARATPGAELPAAATESIISPSASGRLLSAPLTVAGAIMGTPMYMAPEQQAGEATDARTDQFAFCVTAYESLYGQLPFAGQTLAEIASNVREGRLRELSGRPKAPLWLRKRLLRGLAPRPEDRYESMNALLHALAADPARRWRRVAAGVGVVAVAGLAVLGYAQTQSSANLVCRGAERKLAGVWDPARKAAARAAFLRTEKPFAAQAWERVERALDRFADGWTAMHVEACEATRLRGEQSESLLDLRMRCLGHRLGDVAALTRLFTQADGALVEKAVLATERLRPLADCADVAELTARVSLPDDPGVRARVEEQHTRLAQARALRLAGRFADAKTVTAGVVAQVRALGYAPLRAEALYLQGVLHKELGDAAGAADTLLEAILAAEAGRADDVRARSRVELTHVVGLKQARPKPAQQHARHAEATLARIGGDAVLEARLWRYRGTILESQGKLDDALAAYRMAKERGSPAAGGGTVEGGWIWNNLANVLWRQGRFAEAAAHHRRALAEWTAALGESHPQLAVSHNNVGLVYRSEGRFADAARAHRQALALGEAAYGASHPRVAAWRNNLALDLWDLGDRAQARTLFERALALQIERLGREHPEVATVRMNLAELQTEIGDLDAAEKQLEEARSVLARHPTVGPQHATYARALEATGDLLRTRRRLDEARRVLEEALAIRARVHGAHHPDLADARTRLGETLLELGNAGGAAKLLEEARRSLEKTEADPSDLARTRFALARALLVEDRGPARAVPLARSARDGYAKAGGRYARELEQVRRWISENSDRKR